MRSAPATAESTAPARTLNCVARACVFCGGTPTTKEHLWPDWGRRLIADAEPLTHYQQVRQDNREPVDRTWTTPPFRWTVNAVCARCNNGWMSQLEERARPMLLPMLQGRGRELHREGQRTLASWALKTSMMFEHTQGPHRRVIPREEYTYLLEHGQPSERIVVWMATYVGTMPGSCRLYGLDADVVQGPDRGRRDMYGATVTFGPVVFQVFGTAIAQLLDGLAITHPGVHQICPYQRSCTWRPTVGFADHDLAGFADAILNDLLRAGGGDPVEARRLLD